MKANFYRCDINVLLKVILLLGYSIFYLYVILSGKVKWYVHPRMIPYMLFASVLMSLTALFFAIKKKQTKNTRMNYQLLLFFLLPLIMAFSIPAKGFDSNKNTNGNIQVSPVKPGLKDQDKSMPINETIHGDVITFTNSNFYKNMDEIFEHYDQYKGVSIEIEGFVYKDVETLAENEFVLARYLMVCCAADMAIVGFICHYPETMIVPENGWIKVKGIIETFQDNRQQFPIIVVKSIEQIQEPIDQYIYPY